jgi:hypothetical protein
MQVSNQYQTQLQTFFPCVFLEFGDYRCLFEIIIILLFVVKQKNNSNHYTLIKHKGKRFATGFDTGLKFAFNCHAIGMILY